MKQYFKIGEISKLYQIGVDSLRYYEELGLLTPKRGKNGYRLYRLDDIWRLNVIRDLRGLGFSMERIREYLTNRSIDTTELLLNEELNAIHRKMAQLRQLQSNVEQRLATLQTAKEQPLETVTEIRFPARSCHVLYSGYQKDEEMDILMKQLLNQSQDNLYIIGSNHIGSLIPVYAAKSGQFRKYEGVFVIAEDGLDILPEGLYLSYSYRGNNNHNAVAIPRLLSYATEKGYRIGEEILALLWVDIHQSANPEEYITELQIHVSVP